MKKLLTLALLACTLSTQVQAQRVELTLDQYQEMKISGTLPADFHVAYSTLPPPKVQPVNQAKGGGGGTGGNCNCWIEPDNTYTLAMEPNDDGSSAQINLPFTFNLYGDLYNTCFVNNNGNVSFAQDIFTYSASAFPIAGDGFQEYHMVAPFWADVDTRQGSDGTLGGTVEYKLTTNALYVNWTDVGYFPSQTDKLNTFQLIISDGTNTDVGIGNTVSFCYKDMQWTTGSASQGVGGFGGIPATVGANRGNGIDYIQFGRFDHAGTDYDGPFGNVDGISWLDNKNFVFTTAVSTQNIPPIASSTSLCDTVAVCVNELVDLDVNFLAPETGQTTTASYTIVPPLNETVTETNTTGNTANLHLTFIPTVEDTLNGGLHVITYTATDDGTPPLTTTVSVVIHVFYVGAPPPLITGDTIACAGQGVLLTASGGYDHYQWSNNFNDTTVLVGPGTYYVEASTGACILVSNFVTVHEAPTPAPVIDGVLFNCGGDPATLTAQMPDTLHYDYNWSNGSHDPSISVGTGNYTVTATNDEGCSGTSASVYVNSANSPTAYFTGDPGGTVFPGTTVVYTDQSNGNGGTITSWAWNADTLGSSSGTSFVATFTIPGTYPITLTVTTADGCTHTYTYDQVVVPVEIIIPNVFSPNGDGHNDALTFEGAQYYPNTSLSVFNRWGNEVFSSKNYKNTWKPKDVPDGTYFYILKLNTGKEYTGNVTLLR